MGSRPEFGVTPIDQQEAAGYGNVEAVSPDTELKLVLSADQILEGKEYLLPHELELARDELTIIEEKVRIYGENMHEAMSQSSETWHDNAPADAIRHEAQVVMQRRGAVEKLLTRAVRLEYPPTDFERVTVGSRVRVQIDDNPASDIDIVGAQFASREEDGDVLVCTLRAPLVNPILGKRIGDVTTTKINGKNVVITVLGLDQTSQRKTYQEQT